MTSERYFIVNSTALDISSKVLKYLRAKIECTLDSGAREREDVTPLDGTLAISEHCRSNPGQNCIWAIVDKWLQAAAEKGKRTKM